MPTITINKKVFEELVGKKLSINEIKERLPMLGTGLEKVDENEINVEIFPNRPDMLSEQGLARAFSSFIGVKKGLKKYSVEDSGEKIIIDKSVKTVRPFTACAIVKGMKFDNEKIKEVIQIQEKLHVTYGRKRKRAAIGIYPMEKIKFPITYFAEDPKKIKFQPLEYPEQITALQILSKHPTGREYAHLLEGMTKFAFFKDANNKILSMPPVINSNDIGKIEMTTKDVFIECSGFDFNVLKKCLNMIVTALADMGGKIYSLKLQYEGKAETTPDLNAEKMKIDYDYIRKRLGLEINDKKIEESLEKMGYSVEKGQALIPSYRTDILHLIDLAEDVAIGYGYENFKPEIPKFSTIGKESSIEKFKDKISDLLAGLGFIEAETFNLTSEEKQNKMMNTQLEVIKLHNSLNNEYDTLRAWMLPTAMEILNTNLNREYPQNIFCIGTVFRKGNTDTGVVENERLAVACCNDKSDYTEIKQVLDYIMRMLNLEYEIREVEHSAFISGRVGRVSVKGKDVAYIGEIDPQVIANFKLEMPVVAFELNLTELHEVIEK